MQSRGDLEHALRLLGKAQKLLDRCGRRLAAVKVQEAIDCLHVPVGHGADATDV